MHNLAIKSPDVEAIDRAHLARATFDDVPLQRELLTLFDRQCEMLLARMRDAEPAAVKVLAHTLKGSAAGVGAWNVKHAAHAVEHTAASPCCGRAMERLAATIAEARACIAEIVG